MDYSYLLDAVRKHQEEQEPLLEEEAIHAREVEAAYFDMQKQLAAVNRKMNELQTANASAAKESEKRDRRNFLVSVLTLIATAISVLIALATLHLQANTQPQADAGSPTASYQAPECFQRDT